MSKVEETAVYGLSGSGNSKVSGCTYDDLHSARTLLAPYTMRGLELRNRVVLAPLTRSRAGESRVPNKMMAEHYMQRASAGMIVTESVHISEQGIGWQNSPGIYTDEQAEAWKEVIAPVQARGTPMFIQLWHMGRASHESFRKDRSKPVAPSAIAINSNHRHTPEGIVPYPVPRALETGEIPQVVEQYRRAAERAKAAGFVGIELHGANGYLIDQFLQSRTNQRTDRYGGSVENRYRFLDEVLDAVCAIISGRPGRHAYFAERQLCGHGLPRLPQDVHLCVQAAQRAEARLSSCARWADFRLPCLLATDAHQGNSRSL